MKNQFRVAVIGLGAQSLSDHIPAVLRRRDLKLISVCDPQTSSQDAFRERFPEEAKDVVVFSEYRPLIEAGGIDFAIVAVPHHEYIDVVRLLCASGIRFIKEKPFARNLEEAKELMRIPRFGECAFVCAQRRYSPLYQKALEYIPRIGTPYLFNAIYKLNISKPNEGWRGDTKYAGGGCVLDMGYHIIDQLVWWFGLPANISAHTSALAVPGATYDAEDTATISFKYKDGLHGSIILSRSAGDKKEEYALYGSNGSITGSKKHLLVQDREGNTLYETSITDGAHMMDGQLDYFIERLSLRGGFADIQAEHFKNMQFIDRCYMSDFIDKNHSYRLATPEEKYV